MFGSSICKPVGEYNVPKKLKFESYDCLALIEWPQCHNTEVIKQPSWAKYCINISYKWGVHRISLMGCSKHPATGTTPLPPALCTDFLILLSVKQGTIPLRWGGALWCKESYKFSVTIQWKTEGTHPNKEIGSRAGQVWKQRWSGHSGWKSLS